jgi:hypothetical protein
VKELGRLTLGIKAMKVELIYFITSPLILDSSTTSSKSCLTSSKKSRKYSTVQPSGPGLLSFENPFRTSRISSLEQGISRNKASSYSTILGNSLTITT